jgi:hypothetical protein
MAKSHFIAFLLMGAAIAGLGVWMFQLSRDRAGEDELAAVQGEETPDRVPAGGSTKRLEQRLTNLEGLLEQYREDTKRIDTLEEKVAAIEAGRAPVVAAADGGVPVVASPNLERSVEAILEKKEEERQKAEQERRVARMAGFFLRDIEATDDQKKKFVEIIAGYWDERRKIMVNQDTFATPEAREAANQQLAADRDLKLQQVFDAGQMAKLTERLDNMGRGFGRNRGNRGAGRRPGGGR